MIPVHVYKYLCEQFSVCESYVRCHGDKVPGRTTAGTGGVSWSTVLGHSVQPGRQGMASNQDRLRLC